MTYHLQIFDSIIKNQKEIIEQCLQVKENYKGTDLTWDYSKYNIFSVTSGSLYFFQIYKELSLLFKEQLGDRPMWFQSWLNVHENETLLDWHNHAWDYHGYISVDPKNTITEFEDYKIENKVGQVYFGPGNRLHRVVSEKEFSGSRITIGFDVTLDPFMDHGCYSLFPVL